MSDSGLFDTTRDFHDDLCRNIVSLRHTEDLFDDLTDGESRLARVAIAAEMRVKANLPSGVIARGFYYTTAIEYPFTSEPFLQSRYGNGSHGVWYGAIELETSIYETAYHMIHDELQIEGMNEIVVRERAIYDVRCAAILIDLTGKGESHPELLADSYAATQPIGLRLASEGHPGLLAPSARCSGTTAAIFNINVLSDPRLRHYLVYRFNPRMRSIEVERASGETYLTLRMQEGRLITI